MDLNQWRRGGGFEDFVVFTKIEINKHKLIFTVYFPHQGGIIIHVSIPKLDRFSAKEKLLVVLLLPQTVREWNKLDTSICQALSYAVFRKALIDFIWPTTNSTFRTNDVSGLELLTSLRVGFSHFREHKFKHNFQDPFKLIVPLFSWSKQKTPITAKMPLCAAKIFLINEMSSLMILI